MKLTNKHKGEDHIMTKQEITRISIECREGSGYPVWNILMMVTPKPGMSPSYGELVMMAEKILREAKDLKTGQGWYACNADVMAWSASKKTNLHHRGILKPHDYRVTLDIVNSKDEPLDNIGDSDEEEMVDEP